MLIQLLLFVIAVKYLIKDGINILCHFHFSFNSLQIYTFVKDYPV